MKLKILYEDNHIIAVDKEAGVLTQRDSSGALSLMDHTKEYIRQKYNKPGRAFLGLVNRIDRPVSGIVIFARNSKSARRLHLEFAERRAVKIYAALTERNSEIPAGVWTGREDELVRHRGRTALADRSSTKVRSARMEFMIMSSDEWHSLILVRLVTGRKHQIRAQLAAMGMPVVGDRKYGAREALEDGSICLHAYFIHLAHPTKPEPVDIVSPLPVRFTNRMDIDPGTFKKISEEISRQVIDKY